MISIIMLTVAFFATSNAQATSIMPNSIVVEQTATLSNGKSVTIYYQKDGNDIEVYSEDELNGYSINDLCTLQSTSLRIVSQVKGKRVYHTTMANALGIINNQKGIAGQLMSMLPTSIVVEQTATLNNGKSMTIYYKKDGEHCEVFSEDNLDGYSVNDLSKVQSTSLRIVSQAKGKRVYHDTMANAHRIFKRLVNTYL